MTITAAVDGSSLGNPGPAGWAWVVDAEHWDAGGWVLGTNNLGELTAVLQLLKATEQAGLASHKLRILADSQYAINVVSKWRHSWKKRGWTKPDRQPIKNLELIQEIDRVIAGRDVEFVWVKGHNGHAMNERADDLARGCAQAFSQGRTPHPGPGFSGGLTPLVAPDSASESAAKSVAVPTSGVVPEAAPLGVHTPDLAEVIRTAEAAFIDAWANEDLGVLRALAAPECTRVWIDGSVFTGLDAPALANLRAGGMTVQQLPGEVFLVSYEASWDGGTSREVSVWAPRTRGTRGHHVMVYHQSTPTAPSALF